jgi:hypothetical protein
MCVLVLYKRDKLIQRKTTQILLFWNEMSKFIPFGTTEDMWFGDEEEKRTEKDTKTRAQTAFRSDLALSDYVDS